MRIHASRSKKKDEDEERKKFEENLLNNKNLIENEFKSKERERNLPKPVEGHQSEMRFLQLLNEVLSHNQKKNSEIAFHKKNLMLLEKETAEPTISMSKQLASLEQSKNMSINHSKGFSVTHHSRFLNCSGSAFLTQNDEQNPIVLSQTLENLLESVKEGDDAFQMEKTSQEIIKKNIRELKFSVGKMKKETNEMKFLIENLDSRFKDVDKIDFMANSKKTIAIKNLTDVKLELTALRGKEFQILQEKKDEEKSTKSYLLDLQNELGQTLTQIESMKALERDSLIQIQTLNEIQEQKNLDQELSKHVFYDIQSLIDLERLFIKKEIEFASMEKLANYCELKNEYYGELRKSLMRNSKNYQRRSSFDDLSANAIRQKITEFQTLEIHPEDLVNKLMKIFYEMTLVSESQKRIFEELTATKVSKSKELENLKERISEWVGSDHSESTENKSEIEVDLSQKFDNASLNILKAWVPSCLPLKGELDQKKRFTFKIYLGLLENLDRAAALMTLFLEKTQPYQRDSELISFHRDFTGKVYNLKSGFSIKRSKEDSSTFVTDLPIFRRAHQNSIYQKDSIIIKSHLYKEKDKIMRADRELDKEITREIAGNLERFSEIELYTPFTEAELVEIFTSVFNKPELEKYAFLFSNEIKHDDSLSFFQTKTMLLHYLEKHNLNNEEIDAQNALDNLPSLIWSSIEMKRERLRELFSLSKDFLRFFQNKKELLLARDDALASNVNLSQGGEGKKEEKIPEFIKKTYKETCEHIINSRKEDYLGKLELMEEEARLKRLENYFSFPEKKESEEKKEEESYKKLIDRLSDIELNRNKKYIIPSVSKKNKAKEESFKYSYLLEKKKNEMNEEQYIDEERKTFKEEEKKHYLSALNPPDIQIKPKSKSEFQIHFPPGNVETKMREFVDDQKLLHKLINSKEVKICTSKLFSFFLQVGKRTSELEKRDFKNRTKKELAAFTINGGFKSFSERLSLKDVPARRSVVKNIDEFQKVSAREKQKINSKLAILDTKKPKTSQSDANRRPLNMFTNNSYEKKSSKKKLAQDKKERKNFLSSSTNEDTYFFSTPTSFKLIHNNLDSLPALSPRVFDMFPVPQAIFPIDKNSLTYNAMKSLPDIFGAKVAPQAVYNTPSRTLLVDRLRISYDDLNIT